MGLNLYQIQTCHNELFHGSDDGKKFMVNYFRLA